MRKINNYLFLEFSSIFRNFYEKIPLVQYMVAFVLMYAVHNNMSMLQNELLSARTLTSNPDDLVDLYGKYDAISMPIEVEAWKLGSIVVCVGMSGIVIYSLFSKEHFLRRWFVYLLLAVTVTYFVDLPLYCGNISSQSIFISPNSVRSKYGNGTNLDYHCNQGCNCETNIKFSPVCTDDGQHSFFSPCHAGCTTFNSSSINMVKYIVSVDNQLEAIFS